MNKDNAGDKIKSKKSKNNKNSKKAILPFEKHINVRKQKIVTQKPPILEISFEENKVKITPTAIINKNTIFW